MADPGASKRPPGSVQRIVGSSMGLLRAHVGLLGIELEEAREHLLKALVLALFGVGAVMLCLLTLTLALVLSVDVESRALVVTGLVLAYLVAGGVCLAFAWRVISQAPQMFGDTLEQLRRNQERLLP